MIVLADTHALHWWLQGSSRLSASARDLLVQAHSDTSGGVLVSVATRLDLHHLVRKGQMTATEAKLIWQVTGNPAFNVLAVPITSGVAERYGDFPAKTLKDPCDRLIVASALELGVPLVTKDEEIVMLAPELGLITAW